MTWAADGHLYTAYGDGRGFEPFVPQKLSLGIARVKGTPDDFTGENIRSETVEDTGDGPRGRKASGLLAANGNQLYLLARNVGNAQLAWSGDQGRTWDWADWTFDTSFGCPTFLNAGPNYSDARDHYVYVVSPDSDDAYRPADRFVLARVPLDKITRWAWYEFLERVDAKGHAVWTEDVGRRGAVLTRPGQCSRSGVTWVPGLERYLWVMTLPTGGSGDDAGRWKGLAVYESPKPWGPWTCVYEADPWDVHPGDSASFPAKWIDADGRGAYLVFAGDDSFSVRRAKFVPNER
jgi:hypothetical protein